MKVLSYVAPLCRSVGQSAVKNTVYAASGIYNTLKYARPISRPGVFFNRITHPIGTGILFENIARWRA